MRVVIGIQVLMAGYQLPAKYQLHRWREMTLCLLPNMAIMWLLTGGCILATIPNLSPLVAMVIGSCVTPTDPVLSQSIAKGPFADKYVPRHLREIISSEAGANDGFAFPFLMLATYLIRHADVPHAISNGGDGGHAARALELVARAGDVGRIGGGVGEAIKNWVLETLLYMILIAPIYGAVVGFGAGKAIKFALRRYVHFYPPVQRFWRISTAPDDADIGRVSRKWIDEESYLLFPTAIGLFVLGTCGSIGVSDLLACFAAGTALNWDGEYLSETEKRHDEVNSAVDLLLNVGAFIYIGAIMPWAEFHQPELTGITYPRLIGLGVMVLAFHRIPAVMVLYKIMPGVTKNWKEALFMGYFGPIGVGAVFYLEHIRVHLFPPIGEGDEEETILMRAAGPIVMWLVLFSIVVHGLSIPILVLFYKWRGVEPITEDAVHTRRLSINVAPPVNAVESGTTNFIAFNRFSRPADHEQGLETGKDDNDLLMEAGLNHKYSSSAVGFDRR